MSSPTNRKGSLPHQLRTAAEPRQNRLYNVRLSHIEQANPSVRLLQLTIPPEVQNIEDEGQEVDELANPQQPLTFLPGQWLDVHIPSIPNAGGFSITSTPADAQVLPSLEFPAEAITTDETDVPPIDSRGRPPYVELAVQYAPSNPASVWLWRPADQILGTELSIRVGGSFVWPPSSRVDLTKVRNVVFVAGGVGINPLISMLSHLNNGDEIALPHPSFNIRFLYSTKLPRTEEGTVTGNGTSSLQQVLFLSRLRQIIASQSQIRRLQISLDLFITDPGLDRSSLTEFAESGDLNLHTRRINRDDLRKAVSRADGSIEAEETVCYVCGPPGMTDDVVSSLEGFLGDTERVYYEKWW
ncbi:FAD-dependent oxidoreductase [Aspergillus tubingensis]|uniref:FAD-dependent oxidoreductase n=1 Tax=Aspergillus tubingensis TaxID=5068 RepID=UPI0015781A90|nr:oxidoreductase NAD-binding domain-containing protein 1 [Aspergillus tubingensis]GFN21474.1 oxidoreductase NAD-binding domain-containing protein 1 [Aspergillus tubingensis]